MPLFEWTDKIAVGVTVFDNQHKQLIAIINELHDAMKERRAKDVLSGIFLKLENYTKTHFHHEITVLKSAGYPDLSEHENQHRVLIEKLADLREKFDSGSLFVSTETMNFLKDWLVNHIMGHDKKYSGFLKD
ncbi:bacteriohemerythrin [Myxococcota bacterium]|nr:bacteriohemerythrin [Myxococcota bacterium]MBU1379983.1 bacteriohemerythrin [Myxococcota bacterium]MBU1498475.1 bacteriohemerythrin [Myxococcota bacterium]